MSRRPLVIAHRGFSAKYPENTLEAVRAAIELGVDMVEVDAQETRDGHVVAFHDYRLDRMCGVRARLRDKTLAELNSLDPSIPTLSQVLEECRGRAKLLIEIKGADPQEVVSLVEKHRMEREVIVFSLSIPRMQRVAAANPRIPRFGLVARKLGETIRSLQSAVSVNGLGVSRRLITSRKVVEQIHRRGWTLYVWTVNRASDMQCLRDWGVDGLITNHPDRALRLRDAH